MYSSEIEIELTLQMYPIAKKKLALLNSLIISDKLASSIKVDYYLYIEHTVNYWLTLLSEEEIKIVTKRSFKRESFSKIAETLNYSNHSVIYKKYNRIIKKINTYNSTGSFNKTF